MKALFARLPDAVDRRVRFFATASFVVQVLIVATGGAVRLTGSGLGCPTWPLCTDESLISTPEMGAHGVIEFGNRLLSIIVGIVAILMIAMLLRLRRERRDLFVRAVLIFAGTVLQGVIGGVSVRVQLDPSVVGVHYAISVILVVIAAQLLYRARFGPGAAELIVSRGCSTITSVTSLVVAVTVVVGILTTGSGPHAGDAAADRNGLDSELLQHIHSWPAYATVALTALLLVMAIRARYAATVPFVAALLAIEAVQVLVGLVQARLGLPPLLVGIHMVLACLLAAAMAWVVLSLRQRVAQSAASYDEDAAGDQNGSSGSTPMAMNTSVR